MRPSRSIPIALAALVMAGAVSEPAQARRSKKAFAAAPTPPAVQPLVTLSLENPGGGTLPSFLHMGSMYFAGQQGNRYDLRLTNNTGERVEVVITVDGRDVISGELGNYKRQRGYVLEPWESTAVEGFRQSYDQVAAFRFSDLQHSYTGLQGTPQHAGVVGVAVFTERRRSARRYRKALAKAQTPPPVYEPYYQGTGSTSAPTAFPESPGRSKRAAGAAEEAEMDAAPAMAGDDAFTAPAPEPAPRQLGTAYGETQYSSVQEVAFKRRRRRKPDAFLTVYYDSMEGLNARGVAVSSPGFAQQPAFARPPR